MGGSFKIETIKARRDFLALRNSCQKGIAKTMILNARPTEQDAPFRIGYTVTKKLGPAVIRNRIKRRLREAARLGLKNLQLSAHDVVIVARDDALTREFELLKGDLRYCLRKADVPFSKS